MPEIWLPVDFYVSVSRTRKRTLHVPERVVDVWAESRGVKQKSMVLKMHFVVHATVIVDLQLSRNLKIDHGLTTSTAGRPSTIQGDQPPSQSKSN
jgi:hypothetical protein